MEATMEATVTMKIKNIVVKITNVKEINHVPLVNVKKMEVMMEDKAKMTMKMAEDHVVKITIVKEIKHVSLENVKEMAEATMTLILTKILTILMTTKIVEKTRMMEEKIKRTMKMVINDVVKITIAKETKHVFREYVKKMEVMVEDMTEVKMEEKTTMTLIWTTILMRMKIVEKIKT